MDRLTPEALRARMRAAIGEPEITGQGFDLATAGAGRRRWWALGLGAASAPVRAASMVALAVGVAAVLTVGTVIHLEGLPKPAGSSNGPAGQSGARSPSASAVGEFVPEDVTAVSADEWWVLGTDGAGCVTGCTRILHTTDGGQTFGSIPTPPAVVAGLRFVNPEDGWAYGSSTVWATHDGGAEWNGTGLGGTVEELETSGDYVYAIVDDPDAMVTWTLDRSPITGDSWQVVTTFGVRTANLNVHGGDVWVSESSGNGSDELLASTKDGEEFTPTPMCDGAATVTSLAASPGDIWVVCSTAPAEAVWLSTDGGQTFTEVQTPTELGSGWSSIAGASASTAVLAGTSLELTVDGGQSFRTVLHNGDDHWSIVGFTNPTDGFALSYPSASSAQPNGLWRTDDAGASWYEVELP